MKSKGLGDTVEKILKVTGIAAVVKFTSRLTPGPCAGCHERHKYLNKEFPYKD